MFGEDLPTCILKERFLMQKAMQTLLNKQQPQTFFKVCNLIYITTKTQH